jgi:hypothetical protein
MKARTIKQNHLTEECWKVQFEGLNACKTCPHRDEESCGGKDIR